MSGGSSGNFSLGNSSGQPGPGFSGSTTAAGQSQPTSNIPGSSSNFSYGQTLYPNQGQPSTDFSGATTAAGQQPAPSQAAVETGYDAAMGAGMNEQAIGAAAKQSGMGQDQYLAAVDKLERNGSYDAAAGTKGGIFYKGAWRVPFGS